MKPSDIQTEIKQLIKISTETPSVLSIYLDTSGTTESRMNDVYVFLKRAHNIEKTKFRDKPTALAPLEANYKRLLGFLESELEPHFRGVAVFISNEIGLFIPFKSMLPFKNSYTLGNSPYLKQLLELSDDYKPTLLVAMDSREAKIMKIVLGGFLSKEEILSDVEGRVAGVGKMNELKWQHRVDFHKKEHAKGVSSEISRLVDQEGFKAIILSGQPKNVAMLKEEFPKRVLSLVTYEIPLERFLPEQTAVKHVIDEIQK
ncbi:MAG TPA: hypothetical protein VJL87_02500, partial [Bdellovibrionota bacterium]|nr:hypothetical protein [Bdellovibrionota bacterium]